MKITVISDLHGHLIDIEPTDLLLIAGDIVGSSNVDSQAKWLRTEFGNWLDKIPAKEVVGISGNHDRIFQDKPYLVPKLRWTYLQDHGTKLFGLKIWGTPHQKTFHNWAFNLEEPELAEKFNLIPEGTDVVVAHSPPYGIGDAARKDEPGIPYHLRELEHVGSPSLSERILKVNPKLFVWGHIHEARGIYKVGESCVGVNASIVDHQYKPVNKPIIFEFVEGKVNETSL